MPTTIPTSIGPYRIDREIGRGGMGVVFLGHDTRLDRPVAIKALPPEVAADPERLQRFEREAKVLASLSHPNIAAIHGVEESGGARYLILEHVEGESLAERLAGGRLPLSDVLDIGHQIAAGLEAAHEGGIIHRDLKPANVMITPSDQVKLVDFGLAKGRVTADSGLADSPSYPTSPTPLPSSPTLAHSPTIQSPATMPGVILGTAAYLSPEQARGKPVDRRTDIWAFGCVLYECLTGTRAFEGETASDTIAKILEREVDWSRLPRQTPPRIRELIGRCLEKDPKRRLRDIGDARLVIDEVKSGRDASGVVDAAGAQAARGGGLERLFAGRGRALIVIGVLAAMAIANVLGSKARSVSPMRAMVSVPIPEQLRFVDGMIAGDGSSILIIASPRGAESAGATPPGEKGVPERRIYVRRIESPDFTPIKGTEGARFFAAVSHDSRSVAYVAPIAPNSTRLRLYKVPVGGTAPPTQICDLPDDAQGYPAWLASGEILGVSGVGKSYVRIAPNGAVSAPKELRIAGFDGTLSSFGYPLPDDRAVFFATRGYSGRVFHLGFGVLDLKTGTAKMLVQDGGSPNYVGAGFIAFTRGDRLLAAPFDLGRLELKGDPVAVLDELAVDGSYTHSDARLASNGALFYRSGGDISRDRRAITVDANGTISEWSGERRPFQGGLRASPDGSRFAAVIANPSAIDEIWVSERHRPTSRRAIAVEGVDCEDPIWSGDGRWIAYTQFAGADTDGIYIADLEGSSPTRLVCKADHEEYIRAYSWTSDGTAVLVARNTGGRPTFLVVPTDPHGPNGGATRPLFPNGGAHVVASELSRDGRLLAYASDESGSSEVYVCEFGPTGIASRPLLVSPGGGGASRWAADGKQLYYRTSTPYKVMSVTIAREPRLSASEPRLVWDSGSLGLLDWMGDILPNGSFLAVRRGDNEGDVKQVDVAFGFDQVVKQRLQAARK